MATEPTPQQQVTHLAVPAQLVQAIANYLATKPWGEVNELLAGLQQQARPLAPETPPETPPA